MRDGVLAFAFAALCGGGLFVLVSGDGGWNPRTQACAAAIVAGFIGALVFAIRAARAHYGAIAARAGLRHVRDFTGDYAFACEEEGIRLRIELTPDGGTRRRPAPPLCFAALTVETGLSIPAAFYAGGSGILTRDLSSFLQGLERLEGGAPHLDGLGLYGRPPGEALRLLSRTSAAAELAGAGWQLRHMSYADGVLRLKASRASGLDVSEETLIPLREVGLALGRALRAG